jgi:hypothetical protein
VFLLSLFTQRIFFNSTFSTTVFKKNEFADNKNCGLHLDISNTGFYSKKLKINELATAQASLSKNYVSLNNE